MKKSFVLLSLLSISLLALTQQRTWKNNLIPQPVSITIGKGSFNFPSNLVIVYSPALNKMATTLKEKVASKLMGQVDMREGNMAQENGISLLLGTDKSIPKEGYELVADEKGIVVRANDEAGVFYGLQTLYQLLPPDFLSKEKMLPLF